LGGHADLNAELGALLDLEHARQGAALVHVQRAVKGCRLLGWHNVQWHSWELEDNGEVLAQACGVILCSFVVGELASLCRRHFRRS